MIFLNKLIYYFKYVGVFLIIELLVTFITSLLNLLGLNSGITTIILLIINLALFFTLSYINAFKMHKKGLIEGLTLGLIFIVLMILIKVTLFNNGIHISTFIYYIILVIASILGGMVGVNKKSK